MDDSTVEKHQYGSQDVEVTKTHSMTGWNEIDLSGGNQLERGLKSRHIQYAANLIKVMGAGTDDIPDS